MLSICSEVRGSLAEHQAHEGREVQSHQVDLPPFEVAGEPAEAAHPGKAPLYNPATGQEHKAPSGCKDPDHLEVYPVLPC